MSRLCLTIPRTLAQALLEDLQRGGGGGWIARSAMGYTVYPGTKEGRQEILASLQGRQEELFADYGFVREDLPWHFSLAEAEKGVLTLAVEGPAGQIAELQIHEH